jgi:gamma-tubulin complex component 5
MALFSGQHLYSSFSEVEADVQVMGRKRWTDFQTLTSTLRETIERQNEQWLNPHAIRIRTTSRPKIDGPNDLISPEILSVVRASYQVPFPLSQLFTSTSLDLRADVFTFLLQIQFGRSLLDQTKMYESQKTNRVDRDMAYLLRLRHKVYWIIK